ncbi:acetylglutamate kinase [Liquorilactobacillus aquaticus DSM 21051]|uniref:Acetylglutamate kinase n=1 Tax=Liquorilactobacillus aquaticus DSM 21051 TaxID=1423725 RepID=A0A0R2CXS6_9LACO|nr:acetylglutamate kinase [Liquorilactobacillus aquaticus]KRM96750.1 acetylglutamate kinase [Liquorilactobacillus aquaticus DSM 21051]
MKDFIVIKIGGNTIEQLTADFYQQLHLWLEEGKRILLVHGGGSTISSLSVQLKLPVRKLNGIRVSDEKTLDLTRMVLLGKTQPLLLQKLSEHSLPAIGLNASDDNLLVGDFLDKKTYGYVGEIKTVNKKLLEKLLTTHIGVIAPLTLTPSKQWLNVNADTAAADIASLLNATALYLMTDVPGVLNNGKIVSQLSLETAHDLRNQKIITNGMQPKITAAFQAFQTGVEHVSITNKLTTTGTLII